MNEPIQQTELENFFSHYARRVNTALAGGDVDVDGTVNSFASDIIGANPNGVMSAKNDDKFKESVSKGWASYKEIGIHAMNILSKQIDILDSFHAIVKIHWSSSFTRKDKTSGDIAFNVFYLVQKRNDIRIFAYITGNEQEALKRAGLIS
jgi:hypothetical protein